MTMVSVDVIDNFQFFTTPSGDDLQKICDLLISSITALKEKIVPVLNIVDNTKVKQIQSHIDYTNYPQGYAEYVQKVLEFAIREEHMNLIESESADSVSMENNEELAKQLIGTDFEMLYPYAVLENNVKYTKGLIAATNNKNKFWNYKKEYQRFVQKYGVLTCPMKNDVVFGFEGELSGMFPINECTKEILLGTSWEFLYPNIGILDQALGTARVPELLLKIITGKANWKKEVYPYIQKFIACPMINDSLTGLRGKYHEQVWSEILIKDCVKSLNVFDAENPQSYLIYRYCFENLISKLENNGFFTKEDNKRMFGMNSKFFMPNGKKGGVSGRNYKWDKIRHTEQNFKLQKYYLDQMYGQYRSILAGELKTLNGQKEGIYGRFDADALERMFRVIGIYDSKMLGYSTFEELVSTTKEKFGIK
jgi:hypothetical protein